MNNDSQRLTQKPRKLSPVSGKASKVTKGGAGPIQEYFSALMNGHFYG